MLRIQKPKSVSSVRSQCAQTLRMCLSIVVCAVHIMLHHPFDHTPANVNVTMVIARKPSCRGAESRRFNVDNSCGDRTPDGQKPMDDHHLPMDLHLCRHVAYTSCHSRNLRTVTLDHHHLYEVFISGVPTLVGVKTSIAWM